MGKKRSKNFISIFSSIFIQMFGCCVRLNVCSTKIIIKKKQERCGKGTCQKQPGIPWKSSSLLIVIVNEIYFIPHEQSFWTKEFSQGFSDFLYALSFKNENPTKLVMRIKKIKNKMMPSSMTIITVTQAFSEARGCRNRWA